MGKVPGLGKTGGKEGPSRWEREQESAKPMTYDLGQRQDTNINSIILVLKYSTVLRNTKMPKSRIVITSMESRIRNFNVFLTGITKGKIKDYEKEVAQNKVKIVMILL